MRVQLPLSFAALALLIACDDGGGSSDTGPVDAGPPSDRLALPERGLPLLRCAAKVESTGECERDGDCGGDERCVGKSSVPDRGPIELSCGAPVGRGEERARCATGDDCASGLCALPGVCLSPCKTNDDCAPGTACQPVETRVASGLAPIMACARTTAFAENVRLERGPRLTSLSPTRLNSVTTPGVLGTAMLFLEMSCGSNAVVQSLTARAGHEELFALDQVLGGDIALNPVANQGELVPVLVPNNPTVEPSSTGYELDFAVDRLTSANLFVATSDAPRRYLELNVFYAGGGQSIESGGVHPGDSHVAGMLDLLRDRYADIGIELWKIREYDVKGALRDELSVLETELVRDDEGNIVDLNILGLDRLFQLSAGVDDAGINLFLVSEMGDVLGISGGVPGALGVHGTSASGVAIALDVVGVVHAPNVAMHEISHQMGLFHTTELNGFVIEPLSDTRRCELTEDADENHVLDSDECAAQGGDNLMFWSGLGSKLSDQQREILRRSLVLR